MCVSVCLYVSMSVLQIELLVQMWSTHIDLGLTFTAGDISVIRNHLRMETYTKPSVTHTTDDRVFHYPCRPGIVKDSRLFITVAPCKDMEDKIELELDLELGNFILQGL